MYTIGHMQYHVYPLKLYIRKVPVIVIIGAALALNLFSWAWLLFQIPHNSEQVFLHYNILFGVDQIGEPRQVYTASLVGLSIIAINFISAWVLYRKDRFYSYILLAGALTVNSFVAIASILVVGLNI